MVLSIRHVKFKEETVRIIKAADPKDVWSVANTGTLNIELLSLLNSSIQIHTS